MYKDVKIKVIISEDMVTDWADSEEIESVRKEEKTKHEDQCVEVAVEWF